MNEQSVAAVVVSYNAEEHLRRCLDSLAANAVEVVVVVDNSSTDGSEAVTRSSGATWIETGANLGYGRAANAGASSREAAGAGYLLVCNPDVELRPDAVSTLKRALERDPQLGIAGPSIWNPDGTLYPSARTFPDLIDAAGHGLLGTIAPNNRFTRRYRLLDWDHAGEAPVDWVSGACFLVRREAWDAVGGFDAAYFMYMEDVDLCWRAHKAGWAVGYVPDAKVVHVQGVSADRHPYRMLTAHHRSMWRFAVRYTDGPKRAALPIVALGLAGRLVFAALEHRFGRVRTSALLADAGSARAPRPLP